LPPSSELPHGFSGTRFEFRVFFPKVQQFDAMPQIWINIKSDQPTKMNRKSSNDCDHILAFVPEEDETNFMVLGILTLQIWITSAPCTFLKTKK